MVLSPIKTLILFLLLGVSSLQAQDSLLYMHITIPENRYTIESAIKVIEQKTGLSFSYNSELFNKKKEITLKAQNEPLHDVLERVFKDPTLYFDIVGGHLVVYRPVKTRAANPEKPQDTVMYFVISGRVLDKESLQPLAFSSIYLVGKTTGTISNEDGEFQLKLSAAELTETLSISCIGYKNFTSAVSPLVNTDREYLLNSDAISIQEVIIRRVSPIMLMQNARNQIRDNYRVKPSILTSFYRETIQRGNRYTLVSEAILENYKAGYGNLVSDKVKIIKGRKSEDFQKEDTIMLKLKAGLSTMLLLDVVKNVPEFLTREGQNDYQYRLADMVVEDGSENYVIEFTPKRGSPNNPIYTGRILIDIHDFAIKWVEFHINPAQLDEATNRFIIRKPMDIVVKTLKANYKIAFKKRGGLYDLHMIQCETGFRIRNRKQLAGSVYNTKLEMVVMDIDSVNVARFSPKESAKPYDFLTDQLGVYDETFWGEYNFIKPDESLENALMKLKKAQEAKQE